MAESQLMFATEEERRQAIDQLEEIPENEAKIDEIMRAPIKSEAAETPADSTPPPEPPVEKEPVTEPSSDEIVQIKKSDLPQGFDSPAKLFKSYNEAQSLIERQTKYIKEKLGGDEGLQAALRRAEAAEAELKNLRGRVEAPAQKETTQENLSKIPESVAAKIKEVRQKLQELAEDPIENDEKITQLRFQLDDLWLQENERTTLMIQRANARAEEAHKIAGEYVQRAKSEEEKKTSEKSLLKDYEDIDTFSGDPKYPEFKMTKPAAEVERDYVDWARDVTGLYYGMPVDVNTQKGAEAMRAAMSNLQKGAPDLIEKCRVAGVPVDPTDDVKKYLEICELLNYRDGERFDPISGKKSIVERYHAPSGKYVPDSFPSLESAYEDRKRRDGFYEKKIREAFSKGGEAMAAAISRRETGAVEMADPGVSKADAGLTMTPPEAAKIIETIDEISAMRLKKAGDPSSYDKLNAALKVLGITPLD